jgi:gluconate 5-dehydrogenase
MYDGAKMAAIPIDYSAAKGGVINLTRDLAAYLGPYNILVNCISPGAFWRETAPTFEEAYSEATMLGRMGCEDTELGGAVVFLASEVSSYITGHNLVVDGGYTAW